EAIDEFESGGLARAAAAQEHQSFAALDFEIQVAQKFVAGFEAIGDVTELDGWAVVRRVDHRSRCEGKMPSPQPAGRRRYDTSYAFSGRPVMRMPEWPLRRMLRPISSAVICSRMRAFSSLPPSMARTPGIFAASVLTVFKAAPSSLQTITSQSTTASPFNTSAEVLWNAATTGTP